MNKNTIIGAILIAAIMIWWMSMSSANSRALAEAKAKEKAAAEAVVKWKVGSSYLRHCSA